MASMSQTLRLQVWENKPLNDMKYVDFISTFIALIMHDYTTIYAALSVDDT